MHPRSTCSLINFFAKRHLPFLALGLTSVFSTLVSLLTLYGFLVNEFTSRCFPILAKNAVIHSYLDHSLLSAFNLLSCLVPAADPWEVYNIDSISKGYLKDTIYNSLRKLGSKHRLVHSWMLKVWRTDGRAYGWTDGRTDGSTNGQMATRKPTETDKETIFLR